MGTYHNSFVELSGSWCLSLPRQVNARSSSVPVSGIRWVRAGRKADGVVPPACFTLLCRTSILPYPPPSPPRVDGSTKRGELSLAPRCLRLSYWSVAIPLFGRLNYVSSSDYRRHHYHYHHRGEGKTCLGQCSSVAICVSRSLYAWLLGFFFVIWRVSDGQNPRPSKLG